MSITPNLKHYLIYIACWFAVIGLIAFTVNYIEVVYG